MFSLASAVLICTAAMAGAWWGWNRVVPVLQQQTAEHYVPFAGMKEPQAESHDTATGKVFQLGKLYVAATLFRLLQDPIDIGMFCGLLGSLCFSWLITPILIGDLCVACIQDEPEFRVLMKYVVGIVVAPFAGPLLIFGATQLPEVHILGFLGAWTFRVALLLIGYASLVLCVGLPILGSILMFVSVAVWGTDPTLTVMALPSFVLLIATLLKGGRLTNEY